MRKIKNGIIINGLLFLLFAPSFVFSSTLDVVKVVREIESHYEKICPFEAFFTQEVYSPGSLLPSMKARGRFLYAGRYRMKWEYEYPENQIFIILPNLSWMYVPEDKQLQVFDTESIKKTAIAAAFSEGILKYFSIRSVTRFLGNGDGGGDNSIMINFEPRGKNRDIKSLSVVVDIETRKITRLESLDLVGRKNILIFKAEKHLKKVNPGEFKLPDLAGVVILDSEGNTLDKQKIVNLINSSISKGTCGDDQE